MLQLQPKSCVSRLRSIGIVALVLLVAAGCQRSRYRASALPTEFRAAARPAKQEINLANIASPGVSESLVGPGDLLQVQLDSGRDDLHPEPFTTRVADDGTADIPLVGQVPVAGLEPMQASRNIAAAAIQRGVYRRPHVSLKIEAKAVHQITVLGAVEEPGVKEIARSGSNLVQALAAAGGLTDEAGEVVEIIRQPPLTTASSASSDSAAPTSPTADIQQATHRSPTGLAPDGARTMQIDLTSATTQTNDYRLRDRDVVMVRPREQQFVYVSGLVNQPGQFEIPHRKELRLLDAITLAGGMSSPAADKILLIRRPPGNSKPIQIQASAVQCKRNGDANLLLMPGDAINVERTPATVVVDTFMHLIRVSVGVAGRATIF